jgi:hypothetical protein
MEKKRIHNYLLKRGVKLDERVNRDNGGQYLDNFLIDFAKFVREDLINEQIGILKELRKS